MAKRGAKKIKLSEEEKRQAILYIKKSGFYKNRLADYLGIARNTLYRILDDDPKFYTRIKKANAFFCSNLIKKADTKFLLKNMFNEEFQDKMTLEHKINPKEEMKKIDDKIKERWQNPEDTTKT